MFLFRRLALASICLAFALAGCKENISVIEPPVDTTSPLTLKVYPAFGAETLQLGKKYRTLAGDSVQFTIAKLFISEIALVDSNGAATSIDGVGFVDFNNAAVISQGFYSLTVRAKPGLYRGVKFSVGVPYALNHQNPATLPEPLLGSIDQMFWSWNPGFIFNRMEGKVDSAGVQKDFLYHIGTDNLKATVQLATITGGGATTFIVASSGANTFEINADYSKVFTTGLDTQNPMKPSLNIAERISHSFGSELPLAYQVFANTTAMFSKK
ncbi:MAG: hypothetical protein IAF08_06230 [Rhizobacter sp.]|nr:hypothetical protein [Chlorobiales bacterium]